MYSNMALDFGIGLIPVIGDLADAWFKCNTRNNVLLENYLRERGLKNPAAPPPPKQSTIRRWFGTGPHAPGSTVPQTETATAAQGVIVDPALTEGTTGGVIGAAGGKGGAERGMQGGKVSGRGAGTDGGR